MHGTHTTLHNNMAHHGRGSLVSVSAAAPSAASFLYSYAYAYYFTPYIGY